MIDMTGRASSTTRRILVVDDNPEDQMEIRRLLLISGHRKYVFEEAATIEAAWALLEDVDRVYDAVLVDQYLPDGLGTELIARLVGTDRALVPIVVVTVDASAELGRDALRVGAEDFVGKSWMSPEILSRVIENAIERSRLTQQLRTSEARFRHLADAVPQAVWMIDTSMCLLYANHRWHTYFGERGRACAVGDWSGVVHPEDFHHVPGQLGAYERDVRLRRADGAYQWHQVTVVPITDAHGQISYWYGVNTDIHRRKLAEQRLAVEHAVSTCLAGATRLDAIAPTLLQILAAGLEMALCSLWLVDGDQLGCMHIAPASSSARGFDAFVEATYDLRCPRGFGLPGRVWETREVCALESISTSPRAAAAAAAGLASAIAYPVTAGETFLGVVELFSEQPGARDHELVEMLDALCSELGQFILRQRAEQAIEQHRQRLQLALEASGIGLWTWDLSTDSVEWTPSCYRIFDLEPGDFGGTGEAFFALVHPDDRERVATTVQTAIAKRVLYFSEFRIVRRDGSERWVENFGRTTYDERGNAVEMLGSLRDTDAQKRAVDVLQASEQRLALAQRAANVGVWDWNMETGQASWTYEAWRIFTGADPLATAVTYDLWIACVHPDDREAAARAIDDAVAAGRYQSTFRVVHPDGSVRWVEAFADIALARDGRPARLVGIARDITAQRESERARAEALATSELAVRARDQLVTLISHDLRGPLHAIVLETDILALQRQLLTKASPGFGASLDRLKRQTTAMDRMIGDLLDSAILQAGRPIELVRRPVDLVEMTRQLVGSLQAVAPDRSIAVRSPTAPIVGAWDRPRLERAVGNLISNAIKYSPGGGLVEVELDAPAASSAVLRVRDSGIGIPRDELGRVFDWFARATNAKSNQIVGTGVGLAAAKQIIEQHGGTISVQSELGKGSTFVVELPTSERRGSGVTDRG